MESLPFFPLPPRIVLAGTYPFRPGERHGTFWSASQHVVVCLDGLGVIEIDDREYPLDPGKAVAVPWATPVAWHADASKGLTIASVHLTAMPWHLPTPSALPQHGSIEMPLPERPDHILPLPIQCGDGTNLHLLDIAGGAGRTRSSLIETVL